jgi:ABC-2 type transport system ATP-binding protein
LPQPALSLSHVNKKLGTRVVLNDVSFDVEHGDIFGYLGPNGAGKTTSIRILLGLLRPDTGKVSVLGQDVSIDANRKHVGFVLESDGLYENLSAGDNLAYYASIYAVPRSPARIDEILSLVRLKDRAKDKVAAYSKGMRQRLALARAMLHNPDVLILDEPTAGVDPSGQVEVRQLVLDMAHKEGKTILFSSHNLDEVQRICNYIALIDRGEIKLYGRLDELQRSMGVGEVVVETTDAIASSLLSELRAQPGVTSVDSRDRLLTIGLNKDHADVPGIVAFLTGRGVKIEQVKRREASLEEIYTKILKETEVR